MSWEEMSSKQVGPCPCGNGRIVRTVRMDDWSRSEADYRLECGTCSKKYQVIYEVTGRCHPGHERVSAYLIPINYPPYNGPSEQAEYGPKKTSTNDFVVWLIENETRPALIDAKEDLVACGNCSRVKGIAAQVVENRRRLLKSARVKVIANEIDSALEQYDTYVGNAEQRETLRVIEQAERTKYEERRRKVMIPVG